MLSDVGKLAALIVGMILGAVCGTILLVSGAVSEAAGVGIITATLCLPIGYLTGNGRLAVRKAAGSPVIVPRLDEGTAATIHGPVLAEVTPDEGSTPPAGTDTSPL